MQLGGTSRQPRKKYIHSRNEKCTTDAFIEQLKDKFKEVRNETFDRYKFVNCQQEANKPLEKFHSRIKQKAALCNWEELADSLVKSIFIQGMRNAQIQMDLVSEDGDPIGTIQYALARERGQENQQKMNSINRYNTGTNPIGTNEVHYVRRNSIKKKNWHLTNTKNKPHPRLLEMRIKILTRPPEHMPRETKIMPNMQKIRPLCQDVQSRNATPRTTENTKQKRHSKQELTQHVPVQ